ncbi:MAG TPA: hypothetical protein PK095_23750, partial [Myxococcota bacterium]|nr:hypothetical protein [Myxococcota bacterium]
MPLDAAGGPAGSKTLVPGRNPSLIALPEPASWLVMTEVEDGVFRVRTHGEGDDDSDSEGWALPAEARIGVQLCHGGDGLRLTWRGAGGTGFVQRLSLAGAPLDTPVALPRAVTALACVSGVALGLVQSGATVELQDLDAPIETALVPVKTAVAPLDSLALLGTQDTLATSPWLVVGRQGGTAFAVEVSAELGHKTQVFSEVASSIRAAYHGAEGASPVEGVQAAWRVAWQVGPTGRSVETSVREASGWSAPKLLLEDPALVEFALGRDLIAWTTPSGATLARVRVGQASEPVELIGPQSLPQAGSGTAIGSLHCSADHCVRLRRSGSQFVVQPIRLGEDGPLLSPERVISSDVDTYDAALRGDSVLVAHVRYGELLEVRLSATGVRLGGQSFGLGESMTAAPTASGWLIAAVQDGRLFGAAVSELGASHSPRDLFWAEPEAYRVEQSHPQLASAGPDSQTLLLHQRGPVGAFQSRRPTLGLVTGPAPLGAPCTETTACQSGFCVDGVCCEDACFGGRPDCFACAGHALTDGLCGLVAEGSPCSEVDTVCDPIDRCDAEGACL